MNRDNGCQRAARGIGGGETFVLSYTREPMCVPAFDRHRGEIFPWRKVIGTTAVVPHERRALTKVEEPGWNNTIFEERKNPKGEASRIGERLEKGEKGRTPRLIPPKIVRRGKRTRGGHAKRREETREEERKNGSRSLMGYPPRTSCNVIVGDRGGMDELSLAPILVDT